MATNISNDLVWQITRMFDLSQFYLGIFTSLFGPELPLIALWNRQPELLPG
jgi:hypothetical protein